MTRDDTIDVLTAIAAFDQRTIGDADVDAWHLVIGDLPRDYALAAVAHHHRTTTERCKAAHIVKLVRAAINDRMERDRIDALPGRVPGDPQLGGLPIGGATGDPVWPAYEQHDAIERGCPTCGAAPGEACIVPGTERTRTIPCLARLVRATRKATA
jgi:hypothetical protein